MPDEFRFSLLGCSIALRSDSNDKASMQELSNRLRDKIEKTQQTLSVSDSLKSSILTALLLVDELQRERKEHAVYCQSVSDEEVEAEGLLRETLEELKGLL